MVRFRFSWCGFTLIEILATITVATMMIGPIFMMLHTGQRGVYKSADKTYGVLLASDLLEVVRATEFKVLPPREKAYSLEEIREKVNRSENLQRNLVFTQTYHDKFAAGVFIKQVQKKEEGPHGSGEMRLAVVVVQWESVLGATDDRVQIQSFYSENRGD